MSSVEQAGEVAVEKKDQATIRKDTKNEINRCLKHLMSISLALADTIEDDEKREKVAETLTSLHTSIKKEVATLAKKPKRDPSEKSKYNLTKPCLVSDAFAEYVKELRDTGKLGDMKTLPGPVKAALSSIVVNKCSSLLVSTLIISCDNYNQKDRKATFAVTPAMKKHLSAAIAQVEKERKVLHEKDPKKELFDQSDYSSAMNNVIASRLRVGEYTGNVEEKAADLAALQAHLKAHNGALRSKQAK